ncbi:ubiquinol-cytochrome-c reductase complex assembly factor 2 isoform X2 [Drosophila innubila]|uniref:ubiquinol-cytochrome-c reductase complex assembly factor 2 isoform X2 n=1 Tax=Drosophila innubila TaxID=198719 RepID=UPI00148E449A|nr:ubiquinol-cytochrome-c reductase complex assembly factor 2 isoform X2 [Drosophila innubila]
MSAQYQRFLKVLEKWPAEKTKVGRDLGEQIRKKVTKLTGSASLSNEASADLTKQIDALERLSNNVYAKKYQRQYDSTATGLTAAQCSQVLSSEFLQYLNDKPK